MTNLIRKGLRGLIRTTSGADNPPSGQRALIPKSDGWYDRDSAGTEVKLAAAGNLDSLTDVTVTSPVTGEVIRWSGSAFVNAALAQSDITGLVAALAAKVAKAGDTMTGPLEFPSAVITPSTGTAKGRFGGLSGVEAWVGMFENASFNGTAWVLDDTAKPGWFFKLDSRAVAPEFAVYRIPAGANPHTDEAALLKVDSTGLMTVTSRITGVANASGGTDALPKGQADTLYSASGHNHSGVYEPAITAGAGGQYWRGDKTWQTLNVAAVSGAAPLASPAFTTSATLDGQALVKTNDTRLTADQAAGTASIRTIGTTATQAAAGNHMHPVTDLTQVAWQTWTPAWTGSSGNPSLGNGTKTGRYVQIGKTVHFIIHIVMGTTTTYGSGNWQFDLPAGFAEMAYRWSFGGFARDTSATSTWAIYAERSSSNLLTVRTQPTTAGNALRSVTSAVPFAWASTDEITINGTYEAA